MPDINYVPINELLVDDERITDDTLIPVSDGEAVFSVKTSAFKFFVEANAAGMDAVVAAINNLKAAVGSPLVANTAAEMTDENKVYVYTGSETGYTSGHWYYYDGSVWQDGGVYNAVAVTTDKGLSVANMPADSKTVGLLLRNISAQNGIELAPLSGSFSIGSYSLTGSLTDAKSVRYNTGAFQTTSSQLWLLTVGADYIIDKLIKTPTSASLSSSNPGEYVISPGDMAPNVPCVIARDSAKKFVRIAFKRVDGADMTSEDVEAIANSFKRLRFVDPNLTEQGFPPDSKAVGDAISSINENISTNMPYVRGVLDNNSDIDEITETSIYLLSASNTYLNTPVNKLTGLNFKGGWLFTSIYSGSTPYMHRNQVFLPLSAGGIYVRYYSTSSGVGTWHDWLHYEQIGNGKYFAFGDSITRGQMQAATSPVADYTIPMAITKACGLTLTNAGVSGQGLVKTSGNLRAIDTIRATTITGANLITVAYGRNDSSYTLGTAADASGNDTICGRLKEVLDYLVETVPTCQIVVITPTPGATTGYSGETSGGWTLRELEEQFKTICAEYHIPVCTWEGCTPTGRWSSMSTDGTHPKDEAAYKLLAAYMAGQVSNHFKNFAVFE